MLILVSSGSGHPYGGETLSSSAILFRGADVAQLHRGIELGERDLARLHYQAFLRHWGNADRPIAEVASARVALDTL